LSLKTAGFLILALERRKRIHNRLIRQHQISVRKLDQRINYVKLQIEKKHSDEVMISAHKLGYVAEGKNSDR